jgi:hypothetical protein
MNWLTFLLLIPALVVVFGVLAIVLELRAPDGDAKGFRNVVKQRFFPYLESKGFERKSDSMCTTFRRVSAERIHIIQLRWDKYGKPCFSISFGETPNMTVHTADGIVPPDSVEPCHSEALGYLNRKKAAGSFGMDTWFQLRRPLFNRLRTGKREYTADEVVDQLLEYFPEVEKWFETKQAGPHISMSRSTAQPGIQVGRASARP